MKAEDQRQFKRYSIEIKGEVFTGKEMLSASTKNLSEGGICLIVSKPLNEGDSVGVSLFLTEDGIEDPERAPLNLEGKVIWCAEQDQGDFAIGARFVNVQSNDLIELQTFLELIEE